MKKLILLSVILIVASTLSVAQPLMLGLRGGANLSNAQSPAFSNKYTLGWEAGAYAGFNIVKIVGLQGEVLYSWTKIQTIHYSGSGGVDRGKKKLHYLSIPILLRLNLSEHFTINGGPQLNVLANDGKYKLKNGENAFKERYTNWVVGFEINTPVPRKTTLYARYNWGTGFENIDDRKDATVRRFQIGVFIPIIGNK